MPAIGAHPVDTWYRPGRTERLDFALSDRLHPSAQTHLYDHLTKEERKLEVKAPHATNQTEHRRQVNAFAAAETAVSQYGIVEWADRLLDVVVNHRELTRTTNRPLLVICHSTGGAVVKQALSKRAEQHNDITDICLGVVFFATPHHGSKVLEGPEFTKTVKDTLNLKWEMSQHLREEFDLDNPSLEALNHQFAKSIIGAKIFNFVETVDTDLAVLYTSESAGEEMMTVRQCFVDARRGKLGTTEVPIEDEEFVQLTTTHVDTPKFTDEDNLYGIFLDEISRLLKSYRDDHRKAYQDLTKSIMSEVKVDVHQFYGEIPSIKIITAHPSLADLLEKGPDACVTERIQTYGQINVPKSNGTSVSSTQSRHDAKPSTPLFNVTVEPSTPVVTLTGADGDHVKVEHIPVKPDPNDAPSQITHTRRPSLKTRDSGLLENKRRLSLTALNTAMFEEPESPGHLAPSTKDTKQVQFQLNPDDSSTKVPTPKIKPTFPVPNRQTDRFKWIHVPFNHSHWVSQVLTTISQEKEVPKLHSSLLLDKIWGSQHNRSRHASPHAQFVKPAVNCLFPEHSKDHKLENPVTPSSSTDDIQFALYLPYLHWDSFAAMQKRASVINQRREQPDARPVVDDIARGKSLEHKIIWQYLKSDRPIHCRRTLDQYGYPSLRNTSVRDGDQILYKRTKPDADTKTKDAPKQSKLHGQRSKFNLQSNPSQDSGAAKVLMVDQLWLWIVDNETVITFFTPKAPEENDHNLSKEADIRSQIYQDINGDYANQCSDPWDFAALATSHAIKALLDNAMDQKLQVLNIFEEYISILTERQTSSFKTFRDNQRFEKLKYIKAESHVDNHKDLDALLELRDIEDELKTILKLIKEQQSCIEEMKRHFTHLSNQFRKGENGIDFLIDVESFLSDHKNQVDNMLETAQAAQLAFKDLLDMKQKQANIIEAQLARKQTEVAADQSRSIMVFTVFTVIFLPLSFFASVFGINSREWSGADNKYLPLHQIFTYMGTISLAVIIVSLLIAFNKYTRRLIARVWKKGILPTLNMWRIKHGKKPLVEDPTAKIGYRVLDLEKANKADVDRATNRLSVLSRRETRSQEEEWARQRNGWALY